MFQTFKEYLNQKDHQKPHLGTLDVIKDYTKIIPKDKLPSTPKPPKIRLPTLPSGNRSFEDRVTPTKPEEFLSRKSSILRK